MPSHTVLDNVASDLAVWLDQESTRIAAAMAPQGTAPFSAGLSEQQKLEYYRAQLFNPDGTPNLQGRSDQMNRLGPEGFTNVYKAVIKAYPQLRVPSPPAAPPMGPPPGPPMMGPPPGPPGLPPGIPSLAQGGIVTQPTVALIGEAGPEAVVPLRDNADPSYPGRYFPAIDRAVDIPAEYLSMEGWLRRLQGHASDPMLPDFVYRPDDPDNPRVHPLPPAAYPTGDQPIRIGWS
jgi:hypothetical protein